MNLETLHIWLELALTILMGIVLPVLAFAAKAWLKEFMDKRAAIVKEALEEHEREDEARFEKHGEETQKLMDKIDEQSEKRQEQHLENQTMLGRLDERVKAVVDSQKQMAERLADIG